MKTFTSSATLFLLMLLLINPETRAQTIADWQLIKWNPSELSPLLDALHADQERVIDFEFIPYREEGRLQGCGYTFKVLTFYATGQSSQPLVAHGTIAYFYKKDSVPYLSFQIGLKEVKEHNSRIWARNGPVHYAYLGHGGRSLAGREYATASGTDETRIFKYHDSEEDGLSNWLNVPDTLSIYFKRKNGNNELNFDLSVLDHRDAWMDYGTCYRELTQVRQGVVSCCASAPHTGSVHSSAASNHPGSC